MLKNKVIFITGSTRGIGHEIALKCARDGAKIVVTGKTAKPHSKLPGTVYSVAEEIQAIGGQALPIVLDVRDEQQIKAAVEKTAEFFGGIDILINNASAINLSSTLDISLKQYDLIMNVNTRATFACSQACLPLLKQAENPHILMLSPPLSMQSKWFKSHTAYTMSKFGMSMCTLGMAAEFKKDGIAVNSLWPKTIIATAAIQYNFPDSFYQGCRKPSIVADSAYWILTQNSRLHTGNFYIDEEILKSQGITDFSHYALNPCAALYPDLFLD